jgi:hypothetical protein
MVEVGLMPDVKRHISKVSIIGILLEIGDIILADGRYYFLRYGCLA